MLVTLLALSLYIYMLVTLLALSLEALHVGNPPSPVIEAPCYPPLDVDWMVFCAVKDIASSQNDLCFTALWQSQQQTPGPQPQMDTPKLSSQAKLSLLSFPFGNERLPIDRNLKGYSHLVAMRVDLVCVLLFIFWDAEIHMQLYSGQILKKRYQSSHVPTTVMCQLVLDFASRCHQMVGAASACRTLNAQYTLYFEHIIAQQFSKSLQISTGHIKELAICVVATTFWEDRLFSYFKKNKAQPCYIEEVKKLHPGFILSKN